MLVWPPVDGAATPPYRFGDLLALARRSWVVQVRQQVEEAGHPGYRQTDAVLLRMLRGDPRAIGQLGAALGVTRQAARKLADGLVRRGYASLERDPDDGRRTLVVLTPAGREYGRAVATAQDALNKALLVRAPASQLAAADAVLRSVFPEAGRQRVDDLVPPPPA